MNGINLSGGVNWNQATLIASSITRSPAARTGRGGWPWRLAYAWRARLSRVHIPRPPFGGIGWETLTLRASGRGSFEVPESCRTGWASHVGAAPFDGTRDFIIPGGVSRPP